MSKLNNQNIFNARYATFNDVGTIAITDGSEALIGKLKNTIESIILVFRAYGNYKAWCKSEGLNVNDKTFKCFYDLVLNADWKTEKDCNIATAKNLVEYHKEYPIYYTKMQRIDTK